MKPIKKHGKKPATAVFLLWKALTSKAKLGKDADNVKRNEVRLENPIKSVGMKLFLIFFFCIVALVIFVGLFSYSESKTIIENKMATATEQTIQQLAEKSEIVFRTYEDLSMQILTDNDITKNLGVYNDPNMNPYDRIAMQLLLKDKLSKYTGGINGISLTQFLPTGPNKKPISTRSAFDSSDNYINEAWFQKIMKANGAVVWLETRKKGYTGSSEPVFAMGRLLLNASGAKDYVLMFEINVSILNDALAQVKIGDTGQIVIMNADSKLVRASTSEMIGEVSEIKLDPELETKSVEQAQTVKQKDESGVQNLVIFKKMNTSGWTIAAHVPIEELVKETRNIRNITIIMAIIAMIVASLAGFFVARMIGRPLGNLRNLMKEGEQGNLTVRTNFKSKDEIGQVGASFNQMMEQITRLVRQTNQSASDVLETAGELLSASKKTANSAREIATATEEIANGASSLAMEAEKGNGLTYKIGTQMKHVVASNVEMGLSAGEVQKASERGTIYMSELTTKTNLTEEMTRSMVEKVDRLKDSTSSIRKILDVLNEMTKQTNILSLNATIEAARAGSAGRGFMVVADEIRKLAEQSKQSINVVGNITATIQMEIDETVAVLSNAYPIFKEQIKSVKEAELIFKQVQSHMGGFVNQLTGVSASIEELDRSQLVMSEAMTNVSAVSQQSSATSEEVASLSNEQINVSEGLVMLSEKLEQLSNSLKDSLAKFNV